MFFEQISKIYKLWNIDVYIQDTQISDLSEHDIDNA